MNRVNKSIKNNAIALLFSFFGIEIMLSSIINSFTYVDLLIVGIFTIIFFVLYDIVDEKGFNGNIIYLCVTFIVLFISWVLIYLLSGGSIIDCISWLFHGECYCVNLLNYKIATIILVTFIFSSMYYYFTVKLVRMPVLVLLMFISMILYIRCAYSGKNYFVEAYLISFFLVYIKGNIFNSYTKDSVVKTRVKDSIPFVLIIISSLFIIGMVVSKYVKFPEIQSLSQIKNTIRDINVSSVFNGYTVENPNSRSIDKSIQENKDYILYSYTGKQTRYLIKNTFDYYDYNDNKWLKSDNSVGYGYTVSNFPVDVPVSKTKDIINSTRNLNSELEKIKEAKPDKDFKQRISIRSEYSNVKDMPHPANTYFASSKINVKNNLVIDKFDQVFYSYGKKFNIGERYEMYYVNDELIEGSQEDQIMKYFDDNRYREFLRLTGQTDDNDYTNAINNFTSLDSFRYINDSILDNSNNTSGLSYKMILDKITAGKLSTYEKAKAIQDYLRSAEFSYSLKLDKPKYGKYNLDYFIFTSKKGYCVQYATAMTILCRIEGIPAKYVEGYLVTDEDKTLNGYNVNAKRAHAFTEVYIPGYGWKIFDATPGSVQDSSESAQNITNNNNFKGSIQTNSFIPLLVISILVVAILIKVIQKLTERNRKLKKILKKPIVQALEGIINDCILLLEKFDLKLRREETLLAFSERVDKRINIELSEVVKEYYKIKYGGSHIDNQIVEKAVIINQQIYDKIRKEKNNENNQ